MAGLFFFTNLPIKAQAQCPATTYSVGSGVGISNLSGAPAGVANLTAGQSIKITGSFTVDAGTWNITGARVYLTTSISEIVVNSGTTLNASSGSIFEGCDATYKWSAIKVLGGGTIIADACTFNNGLNAVDIAGSAVFRLTGNTFNTCTNGLLIFGTQNPANHTIVLNHFWDSGQAGILLSITSNVTIGFNFYTDTGTPHSTGIRINQGKYIMIAGGTMTDLNLGLHIPNGTSSWCIEMAQVLFRGNTAVNCNKAQYGLTIRDCQFFTEYTAIDIRNHLTAQTLPPGFLCDGNINVLRNIIKTGGRTGVRVTYTNGNGAVTVQGNNISVGVSNSLKWYYGIQIFESPNANVVVDDNDVYPKGNAFSGTFPGGIYLYNCKSNNVVSNNKVEANQNIGFGDLNFGIALINSPHSTVRDNNVDGGAAETDRAISIENSVTDIDLCCNTMTKSDKGLYMLGAHEDCIIQTSLFGKLNEALYYDMVVSTGAPQIHRGNNWSGAGTTWDGYYNGNPFLAFQVEYKVDPSLLPNGLSKIFVTGGNASDWFSTPYDTELNCSAICGNGFSGGGNEGLSGNDYWAMNPLNDATYVTLHWIAKRNLYAKLLANPALLQDTQAAAFFSTAQNGNIGKFHSIERGIANLYDTTLTADPAQKLAELQTLNASIVTEAAYQAYEKTVNTLHLNALAQDDWDFTESEKAIIDGVAALCPQAAGNAVYTARFLQENYRVPYWNMDCAFVGARDGGVAPKATGFAIFPNPAQTEVQVALQQPAIADCQIMVFNLTGQIVSIQPVSEGSTTSLLPVATFPSGCYIVTVSENGRQAYRQKLSIIR